MGKNDKYYRGVTITYDADDSKLSAVLHDIDQNAREVTRNVNKLDAALKIKPDDLGTVKDKVGALEKQVKSATERVTALSRALETDQAKSDQTLYDRIASNLHEAEAKLEDFKAKLVDARVEAERLSGEGIAGVSKSLEDMSDALERAGGKTADIGDALTKGVTVPLVAIATASTAAAVGIDSALTDVRKTVDGTEEDYRRLHDAAIEFSKVNAVSAESMLSAEALGAQLGYDIDQLETFGRVATGLDLSTNMDLETAATNLAQYANITGMAKEDTERYGSTIVALGNIVATTESDVSDMAMRVAAAGTQVGMSEADILGLSAALSSMGINAEAGGTAISTIISQIDADVAKNSDNVQTWAQAAGMTAEQFASEWAGSPVYALSQVIAGLQDATDSGGNMSVMLEELGVESLRQTDVMKRLAGNSDLLTDAVAAANDAWQQNTALTDEVANRNDSLESKLQMLQNRATAVLEQVGRPMADALLAIIDAASPVFSTIENLAEAFAGLPAPMQQAIVTTGAVAAATGPVLSAWGRLQKGASKVVGLFADVGKGIGEYSEWIEEGATRTEALELSFGGLATTLKGLASATAATAVVAVVAAIVGEIVEYTEAEREFEEATRGLHDAVASTGTALEGVAEPAASATRSYEEVKEATRELNQAQIDLADSIKSAKDDIATDSAMLDNYVSTMEKLAEKGSLTAGEQDKLAAAVKGYNDITGASLSIIDGQTGKLSENMAAIRDTAEAYKEYARVQAAMDAYTKVQEQIIKNDIEMKRLRAELREAYADPVWTIHEFEQYQEMEKALDEAKGRSEELAYSEKALSKEIDGAKVSVTDYEKRIGKAADTTRDAATTVAESAEKAGDAVEEESVEAKRAIDDALESVKRANDEAYKAKSRELEDELQAAKDAHSKEISEAKAHYSKEASLLRESLENAAKEREQAYKKAYDLRKSELAEQVKLLSESLSAELDALSDALAESYNLRKSELEKETAALRQSLGKEVADRRAANAQAIADAKAAYAAEEAELRKALDSEYSQRSKLAEKEAKEWQSQNALTLKEYKAQQEAETKAFKAATSERIAAIKAEAEEKKRAIAATDGTREIDSEIKAIRDGQAATEKARRQRERQEKTAELRAAVDGAKTVKSKQEAQKALNDYLRQIDEELYDEAQEMRIADLEAQKAAISEETKAKQEAVDSERDARVARYEEERQASLDAMTARHEAEYEKLSEQLSEDLELRRERQQDELDAYREGLDARLTALADSHQGALDEMAAQFDAEVEQIEEGNAARLEAVADANEAELKAISKRNSDEVESKRDANASIIADEEAKNGKMLEDIAAANATELEDIRARNDGEVESYTNSTSKILEDMAERVSQAEREAKRYNEDVLAKIKQDNSDTVTQLKRDLDDGKLTVDTRTGEIKAAVSGAAQSVTGDATAASGKVRDATEKATIDVGKKVKAAKSDTLDASGKTKAGVEKDAKATQKAVEDAWREMANKSKTSGDATANNIKDPVSKLPKWAQELGPKVPSNLANGMSSATSYLNAPVGAIKNKVKEIDKSGESGTWGEDLGRNLASGLDRAYDDAYNAVMSYVDLIKDHLGHSIPKTGPLHEGGRGEVVWGEDLMANIVKGLENGKDDVVASMEGVSTSIADGFDTDRVVERVRTMHETIVQELRETAAEVDSITVDAVRTFGTRTAGLDLSFGFDGDAMRRSMEQALAAYDMMEDRALLARSRLGSMASQGQSISVNVNIDRVAFSGSRSDIRRASQELAAETARGLSYKI